MEVKQLVSIIVPVYNVKTDYFARCIKSIAGQTYENFECIIIDDGSTKENKDEYKNIVSDDSRFIYIRQDNAGVSVARNRGIEEAKGSFTCFIDSDDWVAPQFLEEAYALAIQYNSDMVFGDIQNVPGDTKTKFCDKVWNFKSDELDMLKNDFITLSKGKVGFRTIHGSACSKLVRTDILKKYRFDCNIPYSEDLLFTRELMENIENLVVCPNKWYIYYQNEESATHSRPCYDYERLYIPFWRRWHELNMQITSEVILKKMYRRNIDFYYTFIKLHVIHDKNSITCKIMLLNRIRKEDIFSTKKYFAMLNDYIDIRTKIKFFLLSHKMVLISYLIMKFTD